MAKLTKKDLEELLKKIGDDENVSLFDQDELDKKISARLKVEGDKFDRLNSSRQTLEQQVLAARQELEDFKNEIENKGKSETQLLRQQVEKLSEAHKKILEEKQMALKEKEKLSTKYQDEWLNRELANRLLSLKANKQSIADAVLVAKNKLSNQLKVSSENDVFSIMANNPVTLEPVGVDDVLKGFLETHQHYLEPKPSGAGIELATNRAKPKPVEDPEKGLTGLQKLSKFLSESEK